MPLALHGVIIGSVLAALGLVLLFASYLFFAQRQGLYLRYFAYDNLSAPGKRVCLIGFGCLGIGTVLIGLSGSPALVLD